MSEAGEALVDDTSDDDKSDVSESLATALVESDSDTFSSGKP